MEILNASFLDIIEGGMQESPSTTHMGAIRTTLSL